MGTILKTMIAQSSESLHEAMLIQNYLCLLKPIDNEMVIVKSLNVSCY